MKGFNLMDNTYGLAASVGNALGVLSFLGQTYTFCSGLYFMLLVPTQWGWSGITTYTYPVAQLVYTVALTLAPLFAGILLLVLVGLCVAGPVWLVMQYMNTME